MTEQRRKSEKEMRDAERTFDRTKRDWLVTWRDDERHERDTSRLADQNTRKRERDQREADRELTALERLIEKREREATQRYKTNNFHLAKNGSFPDTFSFDIKMQILVISLFEMISLLTYPSNCLQRGANPSENRGAHQTAPRAIRQAS